MCVSVCFMGITVALWLYNANIGYTTNRSIVCITFQQSAP